MITFPGNLPEPLVDGYGLTPHQQTIRTDMDIGSQRVRRITDQKLETATVEWLFTMNEFVTFRDWFYNEATGGMNWFWITLHENNPLAARFVSSWQSFYLSGGNWKVTATLEIDYDRS